MIKEKRVYVIVADIAAAAAAFEKFQPKPFLTLSHFIKYSFVLETICLRL